MGDLMKNQTNPGSSDMLLAAVNAIGSWTDLKRSNLKMIIIKLAKVEHLGTERDIWIFFCLSLVIETIIVK